MEFSKIQYRWLKNADKLAVIAIEKMLGKGKKCALRLAVSGGKDCVTMASLKRCAWAIMERNEWKSIAVSFCDGADVALEQNGKNATDKAARFDFVVIEFGEDAGLASVVNHSDGENEKIDFITPSQNQLSGSFRKASQDERKGQKVTEAPKVEKSASEKSGEQKAAQKDLEQSAAVVKKWAKAIESIAPNYAQFTPEKLKAFIEQVEKILAQ